jgi:hypothetical protein
LSTISKNRTQPNFMLNLQYSSPFYFFFTPPIRKCLYVVLFWGWSAASTLSQTTIWQENFSGTNQGWSQNFTDCDGAVGSFAGVRNGRFEVQDMEGAPCCGTAGANGNIWLSNPIARSGKNVSFSINYGFSGVLECSAGGPYFSCTGNNTIDNGHDQIVFEYRIDNGSWIQAGYACGGVSGTVALSCLKGNTLELRIQAACKGATEIYWFDDVIVRDVPNIAISNVNNNNLSGSFRISGGLPQVNGTNYTTVTMTLQGNPAVTATLTTAPFVHNETVSFTVPQAGAYVVTVTDGAGCTGTAMITPVTCNPVSDSLELVKLYNATNGTGWTNKTNWLVPGRPISTWYGITVNAQGCVTCIDLDGEPGCTNNWSLVGNNLIGSLPDLNMLNLTSLYISSNQLTTIIPEIILQ